MTTRLLTTGLLLLSLAACKKESTPAKPAPAAPAPAASIPEGLTGWQKDAWEGKPLEAVMETNQGTITVRLFSKEAPKTVANFVGLASGQKEWTDPATGKKTTRPLYDGVTFHRVIPDFMIQGGDPLGTGTGGPGYRFEDEFQSGRTFDKEGLLAMANSGPATNGSQFFITTSTPEYLNNRHTIFGEVIEGQDVVERISNVPVGLQKKPLEPVVIQKVTVRAAAAP